MRPKVLTAEELVAKLSWLDSQIKMLRTQIEIDRSLHAQESAGQHKLRADSFYMRTIEGQEAELRELELERAAFVGPSPRTQRGETVMLIVGLAIWAGIGIAIYYYFFR